MAEFSEVILNQQIKSFVEINPDAKFIMKGGVSTLVWDYQPVTKCWNHQVPMYQHEELKSWMSGYFTALDRLV